jgi:predicted GNAT family N-acyltransferase
VIEVRPANGPAEVEAALDLRYRVFCDEQGVTLAADQDGRDGEALHIVAFADGRLAGTCRLVFDAGIARLGRMAVEPDLRGRGIGAAVLEQAEHEARRAGAETIRLHAQSTARTLYERGGFKIRGDEFLDEGIPHVTMEKPIA